MPYDADEPSEPQFENYSDFPADPAPSRPRGALYDALCDLAKAREERNAALAADQARQAALRAEFVGPVWRWTPRTPEALQRGGYIGLQDQRQIPARSARTWEEPEVDADEEDFE